MKNQEYLLNKYTSREFDDNIDITKYQAIAVSLLATCKAEAG